MSNQIAAVGRWRLFRAAKQARIRSPGGIALRVSHGGSSSLNFCALAARPWACGARGVSTVGKGGAASAPAFGKAAAERGSSLCHRSPVRACRQNLPTRTVCREGKWPRGASWLPPCHQANTNPELPVSTFLRCRLSASPLRNHISYRRKVRSFKPFFARTYATTPPPPSDSAMS